MIEVKIKNVKVAHKPGITITETYNEDLDTGVLVIPQSVALVLEPFDMVEIYDEDLSYSKTMLISSIDTKISKWDGTREYNYTIGLISPTIALQRFTLPNRVITKRAVGSARTVYDYLNIFVSLYSKGRFGLASNVLTRTSGTICPEMQWNNPTLYEVLVDLFAVVGCVPTMLTTGTISFIDLNVVGSAISENCINNIETNRAIEDYCSDLETEAKNVVSQDYATETVEWVTPRTTQDPILTIRNREIILDKPIYGINKCYVRCQQEATAPIDGPFGNIPLVGARNTIVDITSQIVEKKQYDIMKTSNALMSDKLEGEYKRNYLYYEEGDNVIRGLGFIESNTLPLTIDYTAMGAVIYWGDIATALNEEKIVLANRADFNAYGYRLSFWVEYSTIEDVKFRAIKETNPTYPSVLINNQNNSYTDIGFLNKQQTQTVNRLGNEEINISGRVDNITEVPNLADTYTGNYIVFSRTVAIYDNHTEYAAKLMKDFVRKNLYSGINSRKRYTQLATAKDSFISNHLTQYEFEFSFSNQTETTLIPFCDKFKRFGSSTSKRIKMMVLITTFAGGGGSNRVGVSTSNYYTSNSIIISAEMKDNFEAGRQVKFVSGGLFSGSVRYNEYYPYVDSNGEFFQLRKELYSDFSNPDISSTVYNDFGDAVDEARKFPYVGDIIDTNDIIFATEYENRYKDNREITKETMQFYVRNTSTIFVTESFYRYNSMVYDTDLTLTVYRGYTSDGLYTKYDTAARGTALTSNAISVVFDANENSITLVDGGTPIDWTTVKTWCIAFFDQVIIAVNSNIKKIYLNYKGVR